MSPIEGAELAAVIHQGRAMIGVVAVVAPGRHPVWVFPMSAYCSI